MTIDLKAARNFLYSHGILWERALFAHLFEGAPVDHLHDCLRAYKNSDNGFGHAFEHDLTCPSSNPLALEFLLGVINEHRVEPGSLFDGTAAWLESQQNEDGSLRNPPDVLEYPHGPWWDETGGQDKPDSIVGNLQRLGLATEALRQKTAEWVDQHLTVETIRANEWLFMAYHAYDYFSTPSPLPDHDARWQATVDNIVQLASKAPKEQYSRIFFFAPTPDSPVAQALPANVLHSILDQLESSQEADGRWRDEHDLPQWQPNVTMTVLDGLRRHGRDIGTL